MVCENCVASATWQVSEAFTWGHAEKDTAVQLSDLPLPAAGTTGVEQDYRSWRHKIRIPYLCGRL